MTIKLLTSRTANIGNPEQWGDVIEVPDDEAKRMIAAGQAMETAMLSGGVENAARFQRTTKKR